MTEPRALDLRAGMSVVQAGDAAFADRTSAVTYRLAGKDYPLIEVKDCHTCQKVQLRRTIEELYLIGYTPAYIHRNIQEGHGLSYQSILNHLRKHLPIEFLREAEERERRAKDLNVNLDDGSYFTEVHLLNEIQRRVYEAMARGELKPTIGQAIEIARLKLLSGVTDQPLSSTVYQEAFVLFMEKAQKRMTDEQFALFRDDLYDDPALAMLDAKMREEHKLQQQRQQALHS